MILVTVGTNEQPFDRLVRAAAALSVDEPLVVQYGSSSCAHGGGTWLDFTSFEALAALIREARVVVCHAGVGSIMLARRYGKLPIVVPRRLHMREAVDDHQLTLGRRLHDAGVVTLVEDERELDTAIAKAAEPATQPERDGHSLPGGDSLARDVRRHLERLLAA